MSTSVPLVDPAAIAYNTRITIAAVATVFIVSVTSYILRVVSRRKLGLKLQAEDWIMGLALPLSWIPAGCLLYGALFLLHKA